MDKDIISVLENIHAQLQNEDSSSIKELLGAKTSEEVARWKASFIGKNSDFNRALSAIKELSIEKKKIAGRLANEIKEKVESLSAKRIEELHFGSYLKEAELPLNFDTTLPSSGIPSGRTHPLYDILEEICDIFIHLGFDVSRGPEIEDEYHNFTALNFPADHPAKEMQDTFYILKKPSVGDGSLLLRTHTSPVQIRTMKKGNPPFKFIAPGRVYRHEAIDASHSCVFHQVEGFCVDKKTTLADLKETLEIFFEKFFGRKTPIRFRPSFFPFTEPSVEVDVGCLVCGGSGCKACKNAGYIELLGAGMIHPNVLSNCAIEPSNWQGYAFGMGVERLAMQREGIDDIRLFYKNETRFLKQF